MYCVAYLVVGFHSHLHVFSFNINTYIHIQWEYKTVRSLCKMGGRHFFCCKITVLNKTLLLFWLLLQYTWSKIMNLLKLIPQSFTMRVTRTAIAYCVPPYFGHAYHHYIGFAYCVPFNNKNNHVWHFHLHKKDDSMLRMLHMYNHSCKL